MNVKPLKAMRETFRQARESQPYVTLVEAQEQAKRVMDAAREAHKNTIQCHYSFPLGGNIADLRITGPNSIMPVDFRSLREIAELIERQYVRRTSREWHYEI